MTVARESGACAIDAKGVVFCWGDGDQLPVPKSGLTGMKSIVLGSTPANGCGLKAGKGWCWGSNLYGQLGNGQSGQGKVSLFPVEVANLDNLDGIAVSVEAFACAWQKGGPAWCWGLGNQFQLGDGKGGASGSAHYSSVPVPVKGLSGVLQVVTGDGFACALRTDATVWCWGVKSWSGAGAQFVQQATQTEFVDNVVTLAAGKFTVCALRADKAVVCWAMYGQLKEDGVPTIWDTNAIAIYVPWQDNDYQHARLVRRADGNWVGQGSNRFGAFPGLALTKSTNTFSKMEIPDMFGLQDVQVTGDFGCGLNKQMHVICWGRNSYGNLGNGTSWSSTPVAIQWGK